MIRVVVVDDEPMVCAHLRTILGSSGTIEVVEEAHDGAAGVEAVVRSRPDVVLMDLRMPGVDGITAIERIGQLADPPAVVVLTTFDADQYVLRALRAGAAGFLVKSTPPEDLIGLVRVAAEGHTVLSPAAARRLIAASADNQPAAERARKLIAGAHQQTKETLTELRDIARGIHPPVLDSGLADALASLAAASPIPAQVRADLPERPSEAIEAMAYFCAAELLANAIKHSSANIIEMIVDTERAGVLRVRVNLSGARRQQAAVRER